MEETTENFWDLAIQLSNSSSHQALEMIRILDSDLSEDSVMKVEEHVRKSLSGEVLGELKDERPDCYDVQQGLDSELIVAGPWL
jgi:hypothetical protein